MLLGNKLAPRRGVEPLYSARQADIIDRYMNEAKLGGGGRNRTYGVSDVTDLQSAAFAARHTPPLTHCFQCVY